MLAMFMCSGSRRLTIAHLPHHHHCHLAPQVKLYPWPWLCLDLAVPGGSPTVPPRAPTDRGLYGAIETPDAKIKSYIIATGLCRPTGLFPRDKHQGNRFNPLLSSLCRYQSVVVWGQGRLLLIAYTCGASEWLCMLGMGTINRIFEIIQVF